MVPIRRRLKRVLSRIPLGRVMMIPLRLKIAMNHLGHPMRELAVWLVSSREYTNFTYDLDAINRRYLAAFVAQVTHKPYPEVSRYIAEIENDDALKEHIWEAISRSPLRAFADPTARYGRRLGWYAVVRASKPRVIVETGVDKGLGACVLTAALARNTEEGEPGCYYGLDIDREAGYLLQAEYARFGKIIYGASVETLKSFPEPIDLLINDSDHTPAYEAAEYEAVCGKLREDAIVLSDNAHLTAELLAFAERTGRQFLFFQEKPLRHWYPGAGIGVAFRGPKAVVEAGVAATTEQLVESLRG